MNRKYYFFFKVWVFFLVGFPLSVVLPILAFSDDPLIIDHTCTDITQIPESAINQAKSNLHIAYGHTSHGSQLTTGMSGLVGFANNGGLGLSLPTDIFAWNNGGTGGALDLHDYAMGGDCGYYPQWVNETKEYLDDPSHTDVNVIIWSWCGQVSGKYAAGTLDSEYLTPMSQLETDYPGVTFVYMTGHVDHWDDANNKAANQMIRDYCISNNKVLYDFADIESYDPDGAFYEFPNDSCDYYESASGPKLGNWAIEWQNSHTEDVDWYDCISAHSQPLNANRKAYAAWWLWARLAGWNPSGAPVANFSGTPTTGTAPLEVSFTDSTTGDIDSRSWTFGDGGSSTAQHPTYTYDDPGTYTVSLTVTGPSGSDTETKNNYITVTATPAEYTLTVNIVGSGGVTLNPPGGTYDAGTAVQMQAVADPGWEFSEWSGALTGSTNPTTINMDGHKLVTATFTELPPNQYSLTVNIVGQGSVTLNPAGGTYDAGTVVQLQAVADAGWEFSEWSGALTGSTNPTTITMDGHKTVTAIFTELPPTQYSLTVNINGNGSVTLNPSGGNYEAGTVVELTAVPGGSEETEGMFTGWSGGLSGSDNPETITMDSDKTVTATFIEIGVESGDITSMSCVDPGSIEDSPDKPDDFPYGLIEMEIEVINAGDQAIITIYLPKVAPADYKWYKYTSTGEWVDFDRNVISNGSGDGSVFNVDRTEVTLYITDNGKYDDDPTPMVIRDPSGLGLPAASSGAGSSSSGGGGCFISTAASGPAM